MLAVKYDATCYRCQIKYHSWWLFQCPECYRIICQHCGADGKCSPCSKINKKFARIEKQFASMEKQLKLISKKLENVTSTETISQSNQTDNSISTPVVTKKDNEMTIHRIPETPKLKNNKQILHEIAEQVNNKMKGDIEPISDTDKNIHETYN